MFRTTRAGGDRERYIRPVFHPVCMRAFPLIIALLLSATSVTARAQVRAETIRGRVRTDSGVAVSGATVSATMAPDRTVQQTTTDAAGRYAIRFAAGMGDYLVHVAAVGYGSARKRITRAAGDTSLTADFALTPNVTQLAAVRVEAAKQRPDRDGGDNAVGSNAAQHEGAYAAVALGQEGNLAAIANAIPGVNARAGGVSVLGLDGSQSSTTLNGMAFGGASLPRDASSHVSVATSIYDPSQGGFSGALVSAELTSGTTFARRTAHLTTDSRLLQASSPLADRLGQRYSALDGSIGGSGEWVPDTWYYNNSLEVSRRVSNAASLLSVGDEALTAAGIAPDSAGRLVQVLGRAGVPLTAASIPGGAYQQTLSFASRIDHTPYQSGTYGDPSKETWNVTLFGNLTDAQGQALGPTTAATRGAGRTGMFLGGQASYSRYFGDVLNDTRTALSGHRDRGSPYLRLPGGTVLVSSALTDGDAAIAGINFGGDGSADFTQRSWTWETINETQWYTRGNPHRLKLTAESRLDGYSNSAQDNLLGTFSFASIDALDAGRPSSFTRTLTSPARPGGEWSGFLAFGDYWRVSPSLQLLYGARLEANRFTTALSSNAAVESAFGVSTSQAPNSVHVSPRLGFTYLFGRSPYPTSYRANAIASAATPPTLLLRGGIGEFRGLLPASLLSGSSVANGLPGGRTTLTCIGDATPAPQWSDYLADAGTIPTTCANGASSAFTDTAPGVSLFDRSYDAPRSWRANLSFARTLGPFGLSIAGTYSLNLKQPGSVDLNFSGTPRFTLPDENGRPVFVAPGSIVPTTGLIAPADARTNPAFGRVISSRSDLRSTSRQFTTTLVPVEFGAWYYSLAYTLADIQADARGFDATTFGAPTLLERKPGDFDTRHQIDLSLGRSFPHSIDVSLYARVSSGLPYTPRIAGDVNGDGLSNDRAFIFRPAAAPDAQLAGGMRTLLDAAPSQARECLTAQLGLAADRNSCRGPWTAAMNARIGLYHRFGWTQRGFSANLNVTNPLGGLDQLLHGNEHLQGWGGGTLPDPVLLTVRGFDPAARRFQYEVNPRFGSTRSAQQLARVPFRVTVDFTFDLGVPIMMQQATKLLAPGRHGRRGQRLSTDSTLGKLRRQVPDLYAMLLEESDSLLITREQAEALTAAQTAYHTRNDSAWKETAVAFTVMGDTYDATDAMNLLEDAVERGWLRARDELLTVDKILSPLQMRLAPWIIRSLKQSVGQKTVGIRTMSF
jgi:hypothetical protein